MNEQDKKLCEEALAAAPHPPVVSEDAKDAARYRFLRSNHPIHDNSPFICRNFGANFSQWTGEQADAAIDKAMEGKDAEKNSKT